MKARGWEMAITLSGEDWLDWLPHWVEWLWNRRVAYWAIRLSSRSFARTTRSLAYSALLAHSAALAHWACTLGLHAALTCCTRTFYCTCTLCCAHLLAVLLTCSQAHEKEIFVHDMNSFSPLWTGCRRGAWYDFIEPLLPWTRERNTWVWLRVLGMSFHSNRWKHPLTKAYATSHLRFKQIRASIR